MGRNGSRRVHHVRQAEVARHQQTRKQLFAQTFRTGSAKRAAASRQTAGRCAQLVGTAERSRPSKRGDSGTGEQVTPNGVGVSLQERNVSDSGPGAKLLSPDQELTISCQVCWRTTEMAQR